MDAKAAANHGDAGQSVVEYAMVVGFVCLLVVGVISGMAPGWLTTLTGRISTSLAGS